LHGGYLEPRTWPCQAPALSSNPVSRAFDLRDFKKRAVRGAIRPGPIFSTNIKAKGKNMKRISITIGLCLVSVVAFSAIAAGSASAEPTLLLRLTKGEFPAFYALKTDGSDSFETAAGDKITCTNTEGDGEFENPHLGVILFIVKGCSTTVEGESGPCNTVEAKSEEGLIMLDDWVDHFGGVKLANGKEDPGILALRPEKYEIECSVAILGKVKIVITGAGVVGLLMTLTGEVPKINTPLSSFNILFKGTKGVQEDTEFLLPLKENELIKASLTADISIFGKEESIALNSTAHIGAFENSKKEATEVEIVEG
jgi:hypothetical protein